MTHICYWIELACPADYRIWQVLNGRLPCWRSISLWSFPKPQHQLHPEHHRKSLCGVKIYSTLQWTLRSPSVQKYCPPHFYFLLKKKGICLVLHCPLDIRLSFVKRTTRSQSLTVAIRLMYNQLPFNLIQQSMIEGRKSIFERGSSKWWPPFVMRMSAALASICVTGNDLWCIFIAIQIEELSNISVVLKRKGVVFALFFFSPSSADNLKVWQEVVRPLFVSHMRTRPCATQQC